MVFEINHELLLDNLFDGVYYVDRNRVITYWNKAAERLTGFSAEEVVGKSCAANILRHIDSSGNELCIEGCPLHETLQDGESREQYLFLHHKAGHRLPVKIRVAPIRDEEGEIVGCVEVFSDNSDQLDILQQLEDLSQESVLDPGLKIGNRRYGEKICKTRLYELQTFQTPFCLIMLDIDDFKKANDRYGHLVGDQTLEMVARSLESTLRISDTVIRWGGDEFILLLSAVRADELDEILNRIRVIVDKSFIEVDGEMISVTISLGATFAKADDSVESLVERADRLMYQSKNAGGNRYTIG